MHVLRLALLTFGLAGCNLPPPSPAQRAAAAADSKSGSSPAAPSPQGILAASAAGDDATSPLRCRQVGPDTSCTRDR